MIMMEILIKITIGIPLAIKNYSRNKICNSINTEVYNGNNEDYAGDGAYNITMLVATSLYLYRLLRY